MAIARALVKWSGIMIGFLVALATAAFVVAYERQTPCVEARGDTAAKRSHAGSIADQ
jgi:hypothetical protein